MYQLMLKTFVLYYIQGIKFLHNLHNNSQNLKQVYFRNSKAMATALAKRQFLSKLLYSKYGNFFIKLGLSNKYFVRKINSIFG